MSGNKSNGDKTIQDGLNLMKQGKYQEAISKLEEAISKLEKVSEDKISVVKANVNKGICLYNLQRETEAKRIFEGATHEKTEGLSCHTGLAHFYLEEYLSSLFFFYKVYSKDFSQDPRKQVVLFRIGSTYLEFLEQLRKFKGEALQGKNGKYLDKWLREINYLEVTPLKDSGELDGKIDEVSVFCKNLEELKSDLLSLKNSKELNDKNDKVITFCEKWISKVNHNAINFLSDGISFLDGISLKEEDKSVFFYNKGVALSHIEKYEEAIKAFDEAVSSYPKYALALNNKGNICVKMEKYCDAIEAYTKAIEISDMKYSIAYNNRGQVYFNLKNYKKALEDFDKAIELNQSNYNAWTNKGTVFFYQKDYGKAKEAFEKVLELNPDYVLSNVCLAKICLYLGSSTLSYEMINKTFDIDVRNAEAWRLKGQLLLKDKKYEEASRSFDLAFQYSKEDPSFLVLWKAYARYLEVLDRETLSSEDKEEKPQVVWSRETKSLDERVVDVSKKVINSLPIKSNNFQSSNKSPDKKENEGSKFKNEYYSIIRELEMYSSICCKGKETASHVILDLLTDSLLWVKKNIELFFLPIVRYSFINFKYFSTKRLIYIIIYLLMAILVALFAKIIFAELVINYLLLGSLLIFIILVLVVVFSYYYFKSNLQSINSALEGYELENVKAYVLYLLGCLYYKVGDYFEAKNKLEECIKQGPKDIKKSASQLLDHISANYIRSPWWTWWLYSPTYRWTKRIIFAFSSLGFIALLLFHPFIYSILFKFIYLSQFKDFFTEANVTSNVTNYTTTTENLTETAIESSKLVLYNNTLIKSNEIFMNFDPLPVNNILYYVLVSIPIFILFSPHVSKLTFKTTPVEIETKSPKDFEFILHPCLMDDVVRRIDDIPD
ncbi:MAG: hypothetical protein QG646_3293 [Euryarchaeota archaeon]|nr:hypothetical protein [Euryarchaeota archaeon]